MTSRHLGLALFCFGVLLLASLSISRYAPTAPLVNRKLAETAFSTGRSSNLRLRAQVALTLGLGGASLWIIQASEGDPDDARWSYAMLATLLGYWLKG